MCDFFLLEKDVGLKIKSNSWWDGKEFPSCVEKKMWWEK